MNPFEFNLTPKQKAQVAGALAAAREAWEMGPGSPGARDNRGAVFAQITEDGTVRGAFIEARRATRIQKALLDKPSSAA